MAFRDLFSFLFQRSTSEERVAQYVIREHDRGRSLNEILEDKYVVNRLTSPEQRARLLDRPEILHAVGGDMVEATKASHHLIRARAKLHRPMGEGRAFVRVVRPGWCWTAIRNDPRGAVPAGTDPRPDGPIPRQWGSSGQNAKRCSRNGSASFEYPSRSQKPGSSSCRNSIPRSHLALFQKYFPGTISRSGPAVLGRERLAVRVCREHRAVALEELERDVRREARLGVGDREARPPLAGRPSSATADHGIPAEASRRTGSNA